MQNKMLLRVNEEPIFILVMGRIFKNQKNRKQLATVNIKTCYNREILHFRTEKTAGNNKSWLTHC